MEAGIVTNNRSLESLKEQFEAMAFATASQLKKKIQCHFVGFDGAVSEEVREALSPVVTKIVEAVADVLEESPPELTSDILENGILLTGGGSLLYGLDKLIVDRTHIPVIRSDDPLTTVVRGTGKVLEDDALLNRVKVIGGLK